MAEGAARVRWRPLAALLVPPLVTLLVSALLLLVAAFRAGGVRTDVAASWGWWDSGYYVSIAEHGYYTRPCTLHDIPPHNRARLHAPPAQFLCGNVTWFPGYSVAMRATSEVTGLTVLQSALVVSYACWYVVLLLLWVLIRPARAPATRWLCMALAAVFPGHVYYGTIYPISLLLLGILGAVFFVVRRPQPLAAAAFAVVAGVTYPSGVVLAPALVVGALAARMRGKPLVAAGAAAGGAVAGFLAVLLYAQASVGKWNAYFLGQKRYGVGAHDPFGTLWDRLRPLWTATGPGMPSIRHTTAAQSLLVLGLVALATAATVVARRRTFASRLALVTGEEWVLLAVTWAMWTFPFVAGGLVSAYRAESVTLPLVVLLRRLRWQVLVLPVAAAAVVAWVIDPNYFRLLLP